MSLNKKELSDALLLRVLSQLKAPVPAKTTAALIAYNERGAALAAQLEAGLLARLDANARRGNQAGGQGAPRKIFVVEDEERGTLFYEGAAALAEALGYRATGISVRLSKGGGKLEKVVERDGRMVVVSARAARPEEAEEYRARLVEVMKRGPRMK